MRLPEPPEYRPNPYAVTVYALSLGEASARLGVSRGELEAMIAAGKVEPVETGSSQFIPTSEVERLGQR